MKLQVDIRTESTSFQKEVIKDSREELEDAVEEIADVLVNLGFLDDADPKRWIFIPTHTIKKVTFEFSD